MVRKFLLWTMLLLVVVAGVIAIAAAVCGKPEAILIAVVPALPIFSSVACLSVTRRLFRKQRATPGNGGCRRAVGISIHG